MGKYEDIFATIYNIH